MELGSDLPVIGTIVETHVSESALTDGKHDPVKVEPRIYRGGLEDARYALGDPVARAFHTG